MAKKGYGNETKGSINNSTPHAANNQRPFSQRIYYVDNLFYQAVMTSFYSV